MVVFWFVFEIRVFENEVERGGKNDFLIALKISRKAAPRNKAHPLLTHTMINIREVNTSVRSKS